MDNELPLFIIKNATHELDADTRLTLFLIYQNIIIIILEESKENRMFQIAKLYV